MTKIPFEVSARAGKLLGRENFSNPEGAIIELVKNAYDADSKNCFVYFDIPTIAETRIDVIEFHKPLKEQSVIYIFDNGEGMTEEVIKNHWMKIGTGNKEVDYISDEKRVKTGAKGIGRFALDRLGYITEMWTLSKNAKKNLGSYWKMDWSQFDNSDKSISQIKADLDTNELNLKEQIKPLSKDNPKFIELLKEIDFSHGTILKISNLKDEWYYDGISSVFRNLEALIPPKELKIPFNVYFLHKQQKKKYGIVETAFFNDYDLLVMR